MHTELCYKTSFPCPALMSFSSTGVQCLRTSGKFGCAWACNEIFLLSVFSRISKQTLERKVSVARSADSLQELRL